MFGHQKCCVGNSYPALSDEDYWDADDSEQNVNDGESGCPEEIVKMNVPLTLNVTTHESENLVQIDQAKLEGVQLQFPALNKGIPGAPSGRSYGTERERAHSKSLGSDIPGCPDDCGCCECDIEIIQGREAQKEIKICKCTGVAGPCKCKPMTAGFKHTQLAEKYSGVLELDDTGTEISNMTPSRRCPLFYIMAFLGLLVIVGLVLEFIKSREKIHPAQLFK